MVDCHFSYITEMRKKNSSAFKFGYIQLESIFLFISLIPMASATSRIRCLSTVHILKWWTLTFHAHLVHIIHNMINVTISIWFFSYLTWNPSNKLNANASKNSLAHVVNNGRLHNLPWIVVTFTSIFMSLMDMAHFMFQSSCVFDF
jgi:hypothetical protein